MSQGFEAEASTMCACGAAKPLRHCFCLECFFSLTPEMTKNLRGYVEDEIYEKAYDAALKKLEEKGRIIP